MIDAVLLGHLPPLSPSRFIHRKTHTRGRNIHTYAIKCQNTREWAYHFGAKLEINLVSVGKRGKVHLDASKVNVSIGRGWSKAKSLSLDCV